MKDKQYNTMNEMVGMFFTDTKEFLKYLKEHFDIDDNQIAFARHQGNDDEYFFFSKHYCYSFYLFRGNSKRVMVVEANRQYE